ncbi:WYL domain-containing protein [Dermabacteraceae bacterium TAE3-ERU27]|nr:WYL domain-containing protein [Dermabacteraceae bacterium TAE3-ERU27]
MTNSGRKDIERLANLLLTLAGTRRGYTAAQLMEMVGYGGEPASRERALERDKQALNECGVNIEKLVDVLDENLVRYRVTPRPDSLRPNADEWPLLRAAADTLGRGALASRVRAKLAALGPRESNERYRVADENQPPDVALLLAAAAQAQTVEFSYRRPGSGGAKTRLVEPWQVAPVEGRWYLLGYDRQAGEKRLFRLSRIVSSPKVKGDAREERLAGQDIAQALRAYRAGKGGERREVEFLAAPGKLLHERELAGVGPARERFSLTLSYGDALAVALANPLWCDLVAPTDWAAKARENYARIAALHRGGRRGTRIRRGTRRAAAQDTAGRGRKRHPDGLSRRLRARQSASRGGAPGGAFSAQPGTGRETFSDPLHVWTAHAGRFRGPGGGVLGGRRGAGGQRRCILSGDCLHRCRGPRPRGSARLPAAEPITR